ncbi:hypothetical protein DdX_07843 [Ditylenchus destructor]|uniref:Uncharacterized protein n=1 Tax=Ditylenchus destructor TaxID=166010 RepID=A0AAD4R7N6_9BILA|nr:hypothetical protein DdX_07843 [Ditylenchus destructor]
MFWMHFDWIDEKEPDTTDLANAPSINGGLARRFHHFWITNIHISTATAVLSTLCEGVLPYAIYGRSRANSSERCGPKCP